MLTTRRITRVAVALAAVVLLTSCRPMFLPLGGPIGSPDPASTAIGCEQAADTVVITTDAHLDPSCVYTGGFEITASDVVFDCRGAHIDDVAGTHGRGIHISAPTDVVLSNVTVRNCRISRFLNNVRVTRTGFKELVPGSDYDHPFADIVIENSRLLDSRGSGVFVNGYVTGVTLRNLEIARSGGVGVYLEAGSKDNVVENNTIRDNGYADVDPVNGVPFDFEGTEVRLLQTGREGIAVDGSRNNQIRQNVLHGNAAGGIFLYKNCGEFATEQPNQWWHRYYGADGNLIEDNVIGFEDHGIWVGSRMAENQYFMDCSDPTYATGPLRRVHLDYAADNVLRDNLLINVGNAIRVEDDGTTVEGNTIQSTDPAHRGVLIGTKERTAVLADPVSATTVRANRVLIAGSTEAYAWIHGHTGTVFEDNLTNGAAGVLVPGTQPTINPWLFVVTVWVP